MQFDLQITWNLIWWRSTDLGFEISSPKNLFMYFSGFFYPTFCSFTFKCPWIWYDGGQRTLDSKSAIPKTYICIFLDFFFWVFHQKHCIEAVKFSFFKGRSGWIGGMRVVRLGWNWFLIVSRYCRNFSNFLG